MALNSKNSGKYLDKDWHDKRQEIREDISYRDRLNDFEKEYYDITSEKQIGEYDPSNFNLTENQKRNRGM